MKEGRHRDAHEGLPRSRFRGIRQNRSRYWQANIVGHGQRLYLGTWPTELDAARAYDRAARFYGHRASLLNLPGEHLPPADARTLYAEARALIEERETSRFLGVSLDKSRNTWIATITHEGKILRLGRWESEKTAAEAYDRAARFLRGENTGLNFPRRALAPASPQELRRAAERATRLKKYVSEHRGVHYSSGAGSRPWLASIVVRRNGSARAKVTHLGCWESEADAALAYDSAARFYLGARARLNFPDIKSAAKDAATLCAESLREGKRRYSSRFIGVCREGALWRAAIRHEGRRFHLGRFDSEEDAARAYDTKALELRGDEARLNFHPRTGKAVWGKRLRDLRLQDRKPE
jgi:hypothetical protein